jgi:hypothetical protein
MNLPVNCCPFCQGPARVDVFDDVTGKEWQLVSPRPVLDDCTAYVWCHECGAQGPCIDPGMLSTFEGLLDVSLDQLRALAVERWNRYAAPGQPTP